MGGNGTGEDMAEPGMMHDMSTVESICQACMYQQTSTYILCTPPSCRPLLVPYLLGG